MTMAVTTWALWRCSPSAQHSSAAMEAHPASLPAQHACGSAAHADQPAQATPADAMGVSTSASARAASRRSLVCVGTICILRPTGAARMTAVIFHSSARRSRRAFRITDTELKVIAALAQIGLIRIPVTGYSTPAATGTPTAL